MDTVWTQFSQRTDSASFIIAKDGDNTQSSRCDPYCNNIPAQDKVTGHTCVFVSFMPRHSKVTLLHYYLHVRN